MYICAVCVYYVVLCYYVCHIIYTLCVKLCSRFPSLKIVLEHVSSAAGVVAVKELPNVAGTITVHHLELTVDDVMSADGSVVVKPHNFCKPLAKTKADREALRQAIRHPKFFLGSDSAPHPIEAKEVVGTSNGCCAAGVFTSPLLIAYLCDSLDKLGCLDQLEDFASSRAADFFGFPRKRVVAGSPCLLIERKQTKVPMAFSFSPSITIVPFRAGEYLNFTVTTNTQTKQT
eukprot:GHVS01071462.1.p1 GENE.GHVS01071462.1~~GHVS01071462.1.p1  ORF type:complete len:231 (+),score=40.15 GHVS01071462.1:147-839(+)